MPHARDARDAPGWSERSAPLPGAAYPLGAAWDGAGVNFALASENASGVELPVRRAQRQRRDRADRADRADLPGLACLCAGAAARSALSPAQAHESTVGFTLSPPPLWGKRWWTVLDTAAPQREAGDRAFAAGESVAAEGRSLVLLRREDRTGVGHPLTRVA